MKDLFFVFLAKPNYGESQKVSPSQLSRSLLSVQCRQVVKPVDVFFWRVWRVVNEGISEWARFTREYVPCAHQGSIRTNTSSDITLVSFFKRDQSSLF